MSVIKKSIRFFVGIVVGIISAVSYQQWDKKLELTGFPYLEKKGYTLVYDTRGKIPFWAYEHLTEESLQKNADRKGVHFHEDMEIYKPHQSCIKDYSKSGFDRGHIVPAGDGSFSKEALEETFSLSNICPQHPQFNRGVWKKLEEHIRTLVKQEGSLKVVSGPLFLPHEKDGKRFVTFQVIGENEVAVPTHFFKVVQTSKETWAYVIPNGPAAEDIDSFRYPIDKLEKISGIRF